MITDTDMATALEALAQVPRRRKKYSTRQAVQFLAQRIKEKLKQGTDIEDIYVNLKPFFKCSLSQFKKYLEEKSNNTPCSKEQNNKDIIKHNKSIKQKYTNETLNNQKFDKKNNNTEYKDGKIKIYSDEV